MTKESGMHACSREWLFLLFLSFLLHVHLFSIRLVVAGAWAWTIVGWSLYFFPFLSCSTNGARGDIFFVYADVCELSYLCNGNEIYMLLDIRAQDHGPSLGILSPASKY